MAADRDLGNIVCACELGDGVRQSAAKSLLTPANIQRCDRHTRISGAETNVKPNEFTGQLTAFSSSLPFIKRMWLCINNEPLRGRGGAVKLGCLSKEQSQPRHNRTPLW